MCHDHVLKLWDKSQVMCLIHPFLLCDPLSAPVSIPCCHVNKHDKEGLCLLNSIMHLETADLPITGSYEQQCIGWPNFYCLNTTFSPSQLVAVAYQNSQASTHLY